MSFTLVVLLYIFLTACYFWWQGHSGYWGKVTSIYKNTILPKRSFVSWSKARGFCIYKIPQSDWNSFNAFLVYPETKGLYITSEFCGLFFPSVLVPWDNVHILRTERISLFKKLVLAFESCPGEFAIPLRHKDKIETYANKNITST